MSIERQRGLTLIELVIFMVITGVAAAGIIGVLNIGGSHSADPALRKQAMMIAEAFMEEVQSAHFTATQLSISLPGGARPYANVANYASAAGTATRTFAVNGVDTDINGRPMGQDAGLNAMGNVALAGFTTTVTLNYLPDAAAGLGPADARNITSAANDMRALRITVRTNYPGGFVELDGYRTRYAPDYLP